MHRSELTRFVAFATFVVAVLVHAGHAIGQLSDVDVFPDAEVTEIDDVALADPDPDDGLELLAVPLPIVDPTLGDGLALAGIATFQANEEDAARRSTLALVIAGTNTDSWLVGAGGNVSFADDKYRSSLRAGYASVNLKYYGTSSDSIFFNRPVGFSIEGVLVGGEFQVRVMENLYVGAAFRTLRPQVSLNSPIDLLNRLTVDALLNAGGMTVEYDTRDFPNSPETGDQAGIEALRYDSLFGSDFEFNAFDAFWSHYDNPWNDLVVAGQLRAAQTSSSAPFFMLPFVDFRGFPAGQYLGESVVQAQAELRWALWEDLGAVAFAGAGSAMAQAWQPDTSSRAYGIGLGMRYRVSEVDRLNIGFDVAYGSAGDTTLYFRVGEAF